MKNRIKISLCMGLGAVFFLAGCGREEKERLLGTTAATLNGSGGTGGGASFGTLELASTLVPFFPNGGSAPAVPAALPAYINDAKTVSIVIESVEISVDAVTWIPLSVGPTTVSVGSSWDDNTFQTIALAGNVPPDEYHAIRVRFRSGSPTILELRNYWPDGAVPTYSAIPYIRQCNTLQFAGNESKRTEVVASSLNGYLTPFNVEANKTLYLCLGLVFASTGQNSSDINDYAWELRVGVRVTRIRPA